MARFSLLLAIAAACLALAATLAWVRGSGQSLPDFSQWPAGEARKAGFLEFLRPLLEAENRRVSEQRERLQRIAAAGEREIGFFDRRWLDELAREYSLDPEAMDHGSLIHELLLRVDSVPVSLGLAQAAKESGWGTSRFAVDGNALFGQRCFRSGCGIVPGSRTSGARHEVRSFPSPAAAVASYVRNLNTHPDYQKLRELRAALAHQGKRVTGFALARALAGYSERGQDYIEEIRQMIHFNGLGPVNGEL